MAIRRRTILQAAAGTAALVTPLAFLWRRETRADGGPLLPDPARVLDLPVGFRYTIVQRAFEPMSDGHRVPTRPDGMACFSAPGDERRVILMRNHEIDRGFVDGGYSAVPAEAYDPEGAGGVTRVVLDEPSLRVVSSNRVLAGTFHNCAGGASPWGWLSCEESIEPNHGYVFRCRTDASRVAPAERLLGYGRFRHEAACVDPQTLTAYLTEDQTDGCFYRYRPEKKDQPHTSGRLQALAIKGHARFDTSVQLEHGHKLEVAWVDVPDSNPKDDSVRFQSSGSGAARFCRGEGIFYKDDVVYISCTSGGLKNLGQIFKLSLGRRGEPDQLELFAESPDGSLLDMPDNICVTPWGDILIAEDGTGGNFVRGITPEGKVYNLARNAKSSGEFAGICVSPSGNTVLVNMQLDGLTVAIQGPLAELSAHGKHFARRGASIPRA